MIQRSLRTKDAQLAKALALQFCLSLLSESVMAQLRTGVQRYEFDMESGTAKADGPEDHARMLEAIQAAKGLMEPQATLRRLPQEAHGDPPCS